jgi:hypothetical protein
MGAEDARTRLAGHRQRDAQLRRPRRGRQSKVGMTANERTVAKKAAVAALVGWRRWLGRGFGVMVTQPVPAAPGPKIHRGHAIGQASRNNGHANGKPDGGKRQPSDPFSLPFSTEHRHAAYQSHLRTIRGWMIAQLS